MTVTFFSDMASTRTDLPQIKTDELIPDNGNGVDLVDLSHPFSLRTNSISNGAPVYNLRNDGTYAGLLIPSTVQASLNNGGLQLNTETAPNYAGLVIAGSPLSDIFADQQFIACAYLDIPDENNFPTSNTRIFSDSTNITFGAITVMLGRAANNNPQIVGQRLTGSGGATQQRIIGLPTGAYGKKAQVAVYRTATEWGFTIIFDGGSRLNSTTAAGNLCTYDWSGRDLLIGLCANIWKAKVYRGFVENLKVTKRDPISVLNQDWFDFIG